MGDYIVARICRQCHVRFRVSNYVLSTLCERCRPAPRYSIPEDIECEVCDDTFYDDNSRPAVDTEIDYEMESDAELSSQTSRNMVFSLKNDNETRERLAHYTLFAFVLYDPDVHMDIYQTLQKRYQMLDEDTGSDLLFFSFIKPSKKWFRDRMKNTRIASVFGKAQPNLMILPYRKYMSTNMQIRV